MNALEKAREELELAERGIAPGSDTVSALRDLIAEHERVLAVQVKPTKMWLNAMKLMVPRDEFMEDTGREVIRLLQESPRPEPDEYGLRPWRRLLLELVAS